MLIRTNKEIAENIEDTVLQYYKSLVHLGKIRLHYSLKTYTSAFV